MGSAEVNAFLTHLALTHLAVEGRVSASTQNQALSALLFLYREVLERDLDLEGLIRARTRPRLPVVMIVEEVRAVLERLEGVEALVAGVLYGEGFACSQRLPRSGWRHCGYGCTILMFSAHRSRCAFPTPWGESIPMHRLSEAGNGCFRNTIAGTTPTPVSRAAII